MNAKNRRAFKFAVVIAFFSLSIFFVAYRTHADSPAQTPDKNPPLETQANLALGLNHFDSHCATCHAASGKADNEKGKAVAAADLTSKEVQDRSDADLFRVISEGVPGTAMPAFGKSHPASSIWQLVLFLRKLPTITPEERKN